MNHVMTLTQLNEEAGKRQYTVEQVDATHLRVAKQGVPHVYLMTDLQESFTLNRRYTEDFALLRAYYYVHGYYLNYGEDGVFELVRGMHHPGYDCKKRVAHTFDYHWDGADNVGKLHHRMMRWMEEDEQTTMRGE